jgi:hypothetical protein
MLMWLSSYLKLEFAACRAGFRSEPHRHSRVEIFVTTKANHNNQQAAYFFFAPHCVQKPSAESA